MSMPQQISGASTSRTRRCASTMGTTSFARPTAPSKLRLELRLPPIALSHTGGVVDFPLSPPLPGTRASDRGQYRSSTIRTLKDDSDSDDDDDDLPLSHAMGYRRSSVRFHSQSRSHVSVSAKSRPRPSSNLVRSGSSPSIQRYSQHAPMMLNTASHRRHTFNDLNSQLPSANLVGTAKSVRNSHQWLAGHPQEQQLVIQDWQKYGHGAVLTESMIVPASPPLSPLPLPTTLDMDKLDRRHRSTLTRPVGLARFQSSVTLAFEGAELKKQLEERQRVEAKEMAARELRRQTLAPTTSESVPKDENPRKLVRAPPGSNHKPRRSFLASLFSCFKNKPTIAKREEPQHGRRTASLDTPGLNTSSFDEKEPLANLKSSRSSLRPHLASTHSRTDSLEKVVVDWRASRRASSTPAQAVVSGSRTPFAPLPNATNRSNVPEMTTTKSNLTTKKPSKHSWLDY